MSYIWSNYSDNNKYLINGRNNSSFQETYSYEENKIEVNLALRFSSIFYLNEDNELSSLSEEAINTIVHYLAQKDIINGTLYTDLSLLLIKREIDNGLYGKEIKERFSKLADIDKRLFLKYIEIKNNKNNMEDLFPKLFMDMFGRINNMFKAQTSWNGDYTEHSSEIYYNGYKDTYYYFCAAEENEENVNKFELAKLLFADCRKNIVPIWGKYCFGIIDEYFPKESAIPVIDGIQIL